jgi:KUP system potassium uptake protein
VNDLSSPVVVPAQDSGREGTHRDGLRQPNWQRQTALTIGALGVVYGDIGTSPLYTVRESVRATGGNFPAYAAIMGAVSLIFWALTLIVTLKYVIFVLRADNKGEGGVLSLAALAHRSPGLSRGVKAMISFAAVMGLALFFGDGLLTPAISVLSAVEGLKVENHAFGPLILPISLLILVGLFMMQSHGTARIGRLFGPIMVIWFITIGLLGLHSLVQTPAALAAINPYYALHLFVREPWAAFVALGSVVLAVTGVEALYADMGHFGRRAIRQAWLAISLPGLTLNYLGQAALLLRDPRALDNPFFKLAPDALHYPMVALSTIATVIASQAVISGVFSIVSQSVQLGQLPRMEIRHTSAIDYGQIYVPRANAMMLIGVIAIVLIYRSSDALAAAYGFAVTGMMTITGWLLLVVAIKQWHWKKRWLILVFGVMIVVDLTFLGAVSLKIVEGAWLPIAIAACVYFMMETWRMGRRALLERIYGQGLSMDLFLERADKTPIRVSGTAIFFTPRLDEVPGALLHNLKHNQVLHERVVLLQVVVDDTPFASPERRIDVQKLGKGFYTMVVHFGFYEEPDVPRVLEQARAHGLAIDVDTTTFFIRRETVVRAKRSDLRPWRAWVFMRLASSALEAARFYRLPPGRVVELGTQIEV